MKLACLLDDQCQFSVLRAALELQGIRCGSFGDEYALARAIRDAEAEIALVDTGWNADLEERMLCWQDGHMVGATPLVLRVPDGETARIVRALRAGVADVVTRSLHPAELAMRLRRAAKRPAQTIARRSIELGPFRLHRAGRQIFDGERPVLFTPREFALAWMFFSHPGRLLRRSDISLTVWGVDSDVSQRTMEQHVHRLRRKLDLSASRGITIRAIYGRGYSLCVDDPVGAVPVNALPVDNPVSAAA